jgi:hypothetical protein
MKEESEPPNTTPSSPRKFGFKNVLKRRHRNQSLALQRSRFASWERRDIIFILVTHGIELRDEENISELTLRDLCEEIFHGDVLPPKPPRLSVIELEQLDRSVRYLQHLWITRQHNRRLSQRNLRVSSPTNGDWFSKIDLSALEHLTLAEDVDGMYSGDETGGGSEGIQMQENPSISRSNSKRGTDSRPRSLKRVDSSKRVSAPRPASLPRHPLLDVQWQHPNWQKAAKSLDHTNPRKGGPGGTPFHFSSTTTGRHCFLGGCGEQCDLWKEGQVSEFSLYGPGITNYFKFLKWMYWVFAVLAIISFPELIVNTYYSLGC